MFQKGELIKWYLLYDIGVTKSYGTGIILDVVKYNLKNYHSRLYKVLRTEHSDVMMFEEYAIEKFKE
jgi:hypothetical protein